MSNKRKLITKLLDLLQSNMDELHTLNDLTIKGLKEHAVKAQNYGLGATIRAEEVSREYPCSTEQKEYGTSYWVHTGDDLGEEEHKKSYTHHLKLKSGRVFCLTEERATEIAHGYLRGIRGFSDPETGIIIPFDEIAFLSPVESYLID